MAKTLMMGMALRQNSYNKKPIKLAHEFSRTISSLQPAAFVFPEMFGLANAHEAFDESDTLKDERIVRRLQNLLSRFQEQVQ